MHEDVSAIAPGLPPAQGLYDPAHEHDACGVGFVVDIKGRKSHGIVTQALTVLNLAEPDEERFYKRMRSETAAPAQTAFSEDDWLDLVMHPHADTLLTSVFALIEPIVVARRSQTIQELGYDPSYAVDVTSHTAPVCQSLYYAAGVLGIPVPPAYENPNDPGGISFLFATEPSLVLGTTALRPDVPLQPAAFIAGRQLTFFRPGLYLRHLLGSGTALKSWFFAAIKLTSPGPRCPMTPASTQAMTSSATNEMTNGVGLGPPCAFMSASDICKWAANSTAAGTRPVWPSSWALARKTRRT